MPVHEHGAAGGNGRTTGTDILLNALDVEEKMDSELTIVVHGSILHPRLPGSKEWALRGRELRKAKGSSSYLVERGWRCSNMVPAPHARTLALPGTTRNK